MGRRADERRELAARRRGSAGCCGPLLLVLLMGACDAQHDEPAEPTPRDEPTPAPEPQGDEPTPAPTDAPSPSEDTASSGDDAPSPSEDTPSTLSVEDQPATAAWIAERRAHARDGDRELVGVPVAFQSGGWGCICPTNWIGGNPTGHDGQSATWVHLINESGQAMPDMPMDTMTSIDEEGEPEEYELAAGQVVLVDGYFDGEVKLFCDGHIVRETPRGYVDADGQVVCAPDRHGPDEGIHSMSVLHVTRVHGRAPSTSFPVNADMPTVRLLDAPREQCARVVRDENPPLNVRAQPSTRASVVGGLDDGARVTPVESRGAQWIRIEAPVAGWIWAANTVPDCD